MGINDVVRCWVRRFWPSQASKKGTMRFASTALFFSALRAEDMVEVGDVASVLGDSSLAPGSVHEVHSVEFHSDLDLRGGRSDSRVIVLTSGKHVLACWFVPEISRKNRR